MRFDNKSDAEIESWARKYEEYGKTDHPDYVLLLRERLKRRQSAQKMQFEKSLEHLKAAAIGGNYTSYGQLAAASNVEWKVARHQMNGPHGHLDTLLGECKMLELPLLTAICVNQQNLETGKLEDDALSGFVDGAKRVGFSINDAENFHRKCVDECFAWGERQKDG